MGGKGTIPKMSDTGPLVVSLSLLCLGVLGPNQKTNTGLMVRNDGSEKGGTGSVGGPDKVFVLPSPYPPN